MHMMLKMNMKPKMKVTHAPNAIPITRGWIISKDTYFFDTVKRDNTHANSAQNHFVQRKNCKLILKFSTWAKDLHVSSAQEHLSQL